MTARRLGPFKLGDSIGVGGMSEVFKARHDTTGELVAVKVTHFGPADDLLRRAFVAEITAMARVYHPGIVRIHDWGVLPDGGGNWCAMDWAALGSLKVRSINSWAELRSLLTQVLDALGHAHARGIVHRDLKPDNVLVYDEPAGQQYRLADFGLAYSRVPQDDTKAMGGAAGTPAYMAPEQLYALWREFGPWTDLYALACMAFEFATGRPPFWGQSPLEIAMAHVKETCPALVPRFAVPDDFEAWGEAKFDEAQQVLQEALPLLQDSGVTAAASVVALHLALIPAMQRDEEKTFIAFQRAEELAQASKVPARLPRVYMERSTICVLFGRYAAAVRNGAAAGRVGAPRLSRGYRGEPRDLPRTRRGVSPCRSRTRRCRTTGAPRPGDETHSVPRSALPLGSVSR